MIARTWRGAVASADREAYARYVAETGLAAYAATAGNLGSHLLLRDADGRTEVVTFSLWESMDAVRAWAGEHPERAVFYPDDDRFLIERDLHVTHYDVHGGDA
jgi:heme-degrading monooxygenase HmoA